MFKTKYIFRHENGELEVLCNPMHIRYAAIVTLSENNAKFLEVADAKTGETLMIAVYRSANPNGGFMFLFPDNVNND